MQRIPLIVWIETLYELEEVERQTGDNYFTEDKEAVFEFPLVYFRSIDSNVYDYDLYEISIIRKEHISLPPDAQVVKFKEQFYDDLTTKLDLTKVKYSEIADTFPEYCI